MISICSDQKFNRRRTSAFTLMEMVIALGILAVIASVVLPGIRSSRSQTLESMARILAADLRLARSAAVEYNTEWTVNFDIANNAYELVHTGMGTPPPLENPLAPPGTPNGEYRVELNRIGAKYPGVRGLRIDTVAIRDSRADVSDVSFGPLGGTGPTRSEDTLVFMTIGKETNQRYVRLRISWVTGQVWIDPLKMANPDNTDQYFQ